MEKGHAEEQAAEQECAQADDSADDCVGFNPAGSRPEPRFNEASQYGVLQIERFLTAIKSLGGHRAFNSHGWVHLIVSNPPRLAPPRPRAGYNHAEVREEVR